MLANDIARVMVGAALEVSCERCCEGKVDRRLWAGRRQTMRGLGVSEGKTIKILVGKFLGKL